MMETTMIRNTHPILLTLLVSLVASCSFNPFIPNSQETGNPVGAAVGAGVGAGSVAALGGSKTLMGIAGLAGGAIGYYVTTLRYDAGGIIQSGGTVYHVGELVGIYLPSDQLFDANTDEFLPQAQPILNSVVDVLNRYPSNHLLVSGNTSGFYRSRWERFISERRAQKVSAFLWNAGINNFKHPSNDIRKLNYVGYGDYFPLSQTLTNKGIRQNSRIQITSYPSDCDLELDKRNVSVHNIGGLNTDNDIVFAKSNCDTMNSKGECL
jgi:outer membrane protein OmpA-like peptidoglycan-associated protein